VVAYVRTVKTASGAIAVQIVWSSRRGSRSMEHLGSAHDAAQLEALTAAATQRLAEGQGALDLGLDSAGISGGPLEICGMPCAGPTTCSGSITLSAVTRCSGIWCWPGSSSRPVSPIRCGVLAETGVEPVSYRPVRRRLSVIATTVLEILKAAGVRIRPQGSR
jgi:hypothetical protein